VRSQLVLSDSCRLNDPVFVRREIREISGPVLFASLDASRPGFSAVIGAAAAGNELLAYRRWTECRCAHPGPRYITSSLHQLIDTERLEDLPAFREMMRLERGERDTIMARSAAIMANRLWTWGSSQVDFGDSVDFDRDIGRSGKYGFHYWGWSKPLLQAFVVTGDRRYLRKFDSLFVRWYGQRNAIRRTIPDFDVVYYELGLGVRNRYFIEYDRLSGADLPAASRGKLMKTFLGAARWLYELERTEGYRPGNWQMHGSYMLAQIALTYPEFKESGAWLDLGLRRLEEHVDRDFLEDGGHSEHSPRNYTLATYALLRNMAYLLQVHEVRPDVALHLRSRLSRTVEWWVSMLAPTGEIPAINDSQRGLFPRTILEDAAVEYHRPEILGVVRSLFGDSAGSGARSTLPVFTSRHMPASGFTVMRSDWTRDALYMNINHGRSSPTHSHNDILSFELYAYGRALAVDAGIGATYDDPDHARWFMSSRAHNMVVINDRDLVREGNEGRDIRWDSTATVQVFSGWHAGYPGVRCARTIVFVKPSYWLIYDEITTSRSGDTVSWYLHSPSPLAHPGGDWSTTGAPGLWILPASGKFTSRAGIGRAASTTDADPGKTQQAGWISFDRLGSAGGVVEFPVFLVPFRFPGPAPACTAVGPRHFRITTPDFADDLFLGPANEGGAGVSSDGNCVWLRSSGGRLRTAALVGGTSLMVGRTDLVHLPARGSAEVTIH